MSVKVFYTRENKAVKETKKYFKENGIGYEAQDMNKKSLSWKEFLQIIELTEEGIDSIIPNKPIKEAKIIMDEIDFDSITLKQFYELAVENPIILRNPIVVNRNNLMVGFNENNLCLFRDRKSKRERFSALLESVRMRERYELEEELGYSFQ